MLSDIELARLCGAIYEDPSPVSWDKQYTSLMGHAALKHIDGINYLVRRGSKEPLDWYRDFDALPVEFSQLGTHVHPGILAGVLWSFQEMEADLGDRFVLAGHSLGAGEVILQSGLLSKRGKHALATVAFEPPRVAFESLCDPATTRCYRNQGDPVTEVPELEVPFFGRYVPERSFIELSGAPAPADRGELRAHHIACVIAGLEKLA